MLWSWGNSGHGRLGQGRDVGHVVQPQAVPAMISSPATMISCGTNVMATYVPSRLVGAPRRAPPVVPPRRAAAAGAPCRAPPVVPPRRAAAKQEGEEEEEKSKKSKHLSLS